MSPTFFPTPGDFRQWLENNHETASELIVGYYKKATGLPSMTWPDSVDQALCYGWIDGIRRSIDDKSYSIRFTPRRPNSIWSAVNVKKVEELKKLGLMKPAGLAAYALKDDKKSEVYSFEQHKIALSKEYIAIFKANKSAWKNFNEMIPSYKRPAIWWVMSAKQEATRLRRLETLISDSEQGRKIKQLRRPGE